jgi:hypothetical protein
MLRLHPMLTFDEKMARVEAVIFELAMGRIANGEN